MKSPLVSVIIATYNSGPIFAKVLRSIRNQRYPKSKIEILVVDGNSTDKTLMIAKKFKCKILVNPKRDQVYGKFIGYKKSKGEYVMLIDSDEELLNRNSIKNKVKILQVNKNIKAVVSSGYQKPASFPAITDYLNEFGDPFSFFIYRSPRNNDSFLPWLLSNYKSLLNDNEKAIFDFSNTHPPFIELTSMSVLVDKKYIKENLPSIFKRPSEHTHLFYLLNKKKKLFAITKKDALMHYSVNSWSAYLRKIRSRITSNIFATEMGQAGFKGRERFQENNRYKKYLFLIYGLTLVFPIADGILLTFTRKKFIYLAHSFLTYYTCILIVFFYARKVLHINTKLYAYGGR